MNRSASNLRERTIRNCTTSSSKFHVTHVGTLYRFPFTTGGLPSVMR
jgi:hypothetical protein